MLRIDPALCRAVQLSQQAYGLDHDDRPEPMHTAFAAAAAIYQRRFPNVSGESRCGSGG